MNYQRSIGRPPSGLLAAPTVAVNFERLAALAANIFIWLAIARLILTY